MAQKWLFRLKMAARDFGWLKSMPVILLSLRITLNHQKMAKMALNAKFLPAVAYQVLN